jgi:hypothetical protein
MLIGDRHLTSERFGGFTFEAGVIGGMSGIFIVVNLSILIMGLWDSRLRMPSIMQLISAVGIICGLGAIYLSRTKSGLIILVFGMIVMAFAMLFIKRGVPLWTKTILWGAIIAAFASFPVAYRITKNTANGEYIEKEVSNVYLLLNRGFTREEGGGLQTRIQSMKIAVYGLLFRPTGAGYTNGYFYAQPVMKYVEPTAEMEWFHNQGRYNGYKGAIFNLMGQGGVLAIILLVYLLKTICRGMVNSGAAGGGAIAALLVSGVVMLGFTVELLPYFEIIMLLVGLAYVVVYQLSGLGRLSGAAFATGFHSHLSGTTRVRRFFRAAQYIKE